MKGSIPENLRIHESVKLYILTELVEPLYIKEIHVIIRTKECCKTTAQIFETLSKVLVAVGTILSFSSGYFKLSTLGFIAGSISTCSLALLQLASFFYNEYRKQTRDLNILLQKLNLDSIPELPGTVNCAPDVGLQECKPTDFKQQSKLELHKDERM